MTAVCLSLFTGFFLGGIAMHIGVSSFALANASPPRPSSVLRVEGMEEKRIEDIMQQAEAGLDAANVPKVAEKTHGSIESAGLDLVEKVMQIIFVKPLMLLFAMLFGGGR